MVSIRNIFDFQLFEDLYVLPVDYVSYAWVEILLEKVLR